MITIYLARHGQTEENISRIFQGHLPGHLTEEGKRQAVELGKRLRDILLDAILSSDLQRVIDTVRLAVGDRNLPWQTTPLLREIDWGSWTGLPLDSVDRTYLPADAETRIIRKSKFPQNPKRSVRFSGKRTKRSVQKRKARNTQKAETKVL